MRVTRIYLKCPMRCWRDREWFPYKLRWCIVLNLILSRMFLCFINNVTFCSIQWYVIHDINGGTYERCSATTIDWRAETNRQGTRRMGFVPVMRLNWYFLFSHQNNLPADTHFLNDLQPVIGTRTPLVMIIGLARGYQIWALLVTP
jgi:hypothetical protein